MNYREITVPCYKCEKRHMGCHGECDLYALFDEKNKERRERVHKETENNLAKEELIRKQAKRSGSYLRNVYF